MKNKYTQSGNVVEKYLGRIIRVYTEDTLIGNGKTIAFEYAERSPGVRVMIFNDEGLLLTKEWRIEHKNFDYRLPGGKVFDHLSDYLLCKEKYGDTPEEIIKAAASKELAEETGFYVNPLHLHKAHTSRAGATIVWDLHYLEYQTPKKPCFSNKIATDEGEVTEPTWLPWSEVIKYCLQGKISEDRSVAVILKKALGTH